MRKLICKPEPIEVDLARSAVVVVDMQNAFASKDGLLDIAELIFRAPRESSAPSKPFCRQRGKRASRLSIFRWDTNRT